MWTATLCRLAHPGVLKVFYKDKKKPLYYYAESGFLEFFKNKATLVVETLETPEDISLVEIQAAESQAQKILEDKTSQVQDIELALEGQIKARARQALLDISTTKTSS